MSKIARFCGIALLVGCRAPVVPPVAATDHKTPPAPKEAFPPEVPEPPTERTALEECVAPIDPTVFFRNDQPKKTESLPELPRRPGLLDLVDPCQHAPSSVECAYHEARTHFVQRRFDLAAKGFRRIALETEPTDQGLAAGELALESLNLLATQADPPRPRCWEVIESDTDKLLERYCNKPVQSERDQRCAILLRIARDIRRLRIEKLVTAADRGGPDDPSVLYERAGDEYVTLFDDACPPKVKRASAPVGTCGELLFSAYQVYRAARVLPKMESTYRTFFDPRAGLSDSPLAEKLLGTPEE